MRGVLKVVSGSKAGLSSGVSGGCAWDACPTVFAPPRRNNNRSFGEISNKIHGISEISRIGLCHT